MTENEKICPIMSGISPCVSGGYIHNEVYDGPTPVTSYARVCKVKCIRGECMFWREYTPVDDIDPVRGGSCGVCTHRFI